MASSSGGSVVRNCGQILTILVMVLLPCYYCQNLNSPRFLTQPSTVNVSEKATVGDDVMTCQATDDDTGLAGELHFSIIGGTGADTFSINSSTCDVTVANQLDFENITEYDVIIKASDLDPENSTSATLTFTVKIVDVNEHEPTFTNTPASPVPLPEDAETGTTVFTCSVSDEDSDSLPSGQHTFSITGGNTDDKFSLNSSSCALVLVDDLDFEIQAQYNITIQASDLDPTSPRSASTVISIDLTDVNEKPSIQNLPGDPMQIAEDIAMATVIFTCNGRDPDLSGLPHGQLSYSITAGNEDGKFSVNNSTCAVTVSGQLDFESVTLYTLTIQAQDADPADSQSVSRPLIISVTDVNEYTPSFTNTSTLPVEMGEHSSTVTTVFTCNATDQDSATQPSGQLRYSLSGGDGKFSLENNEVCLVTVTQPLDFEAKSTYPLTLTVRDLDLNITRSSTLTFVVTVIDENDRPLLQNTTSMPTVQENSPAGTVLLNCSATDQDNPSLPSGQLNYSLVSGNVDGAFTLVPPCRIATSRSLDHEVRVLYDLEISVTDLDPVDPQTDTHVYTVKVSDINDNTPYFFSVPDNPISLSEDLPLGVPFVNCSGDDNDTSLEPTGQVQFAIIAGNEEGLFTVDNATCNMSLVKPLDFDNGTWSFNITVRIFDLDPLSPRSAEQEYRICVTPVNDHDPTWVEVLPKKTEIAENSPLGTHLGRCSATDGDSPLFPSGHVRYKISAGNKVGLFYLDSFTCDLFINGLLDYEDKKAHNLKILAVDLDPVNGRSSKTMKVKVKVTDENDSGPTCQSSVMTREVPESTAAKDVVMTLNCTDLDTFSRGALRYTALSKSKTLKVERMTGEVVLLKRQDWDNPRKDKEHDLLILVEDNTKPANKTTVTARIIITDSDDIRPDFVQSQYEEFIFENLRRGSTVLTVSATDGDAPDTPASDITYIIDPLSDENERFLLDPVTGAVILKDAIDGDVILMRDFNVFAYSSNQSDRRGKARITIYIEDVNDTGPEFTQDVYHVNVTEETPQNERILRVRAKDYDWGLDGQLRYSIGDGPMEIDTSTGDVRLKNRLNFEASRFYGVSVEAHDLGIPSVTATASILLFVHPTNEGSPVWGNGIRVRVPEDTMPGTTIYQLTARDSDHGLDGVVVFSSLSPLSPSLPFIVHPTGSVTLAAPLDYDSVDSYTIVISASDSSQQPRSATTTVDVIVGDVNDVAPVCRPVPVFVALYPWTGSVIATLDCSDDAAQLSYRIVGGDPEGVFKMDSVSGDVTATAKPSQPQYDVSVEVSDSSNPAMTSSVSVVILVEPELNFTNLPANMTVSEVERVGTVVFTPLACCSYTAVTFELVSGNDNDLFRLHSGTGDVTVVSQLDREMSSQHGHALVVGVRDEGGQTATATLLIDLGDVNDNAPVFHPVFKSFEITELQQVSTPIGQLTATDQDAGINASLTYCLLDSAGGTFSVDRDSGVLTLDRTVDSETDNRSYTLLVVATDGGATPLNATATVQIVVKDSDEYNPQFTNGPGTVTIRENFPLGVIAFVIEAADDDITDVIRYTLSGTGLPFQVLQDTGEVILQSPLDRETVPVYQLQFEAFNNRGDGTNLTVEVQIEDVDDNDPLFSTSVYQFYTPHGTGADVIVGRVNVSDDDIGSNADFFVSIISGNGAGYFILDGLEIKTARPLHYDGVKEFLLTMKAQPAGNASDNYRYSEASVRIEVLPSIAEPKFANSTLRITLPENSAVNTFIFDLDATALGATEGSNGTLRYVMRSGHGYFSVNEDTGVVHVSGVIDYEANKVIPVTVDAKNRDNPSFKDSVLLTVEVVNLNDNAPKPKSPVNQLTVDEDDTVGTLAEQVIFTDADDGVFGEFNITLSVCSHFTIDANSGAVSVIKALNYNNQSVHTCLVTATDAGRPPLSGVTSLVVTVRDVNDNPPWFVSAPYTLNVYENTLPGATLTTVLAVDMDTEERGEVTYTLLSGNTGNTFALNESTGTLILAAHLDATLTSQFVLEVQASDGGSPPLTSNATVSVKVIDVNDHAPVFTVTSVEVTVERLSVPGKEVAVLNATDDDLHDNALISFAITAGDPGGLFFIDRSSGQVTTRASLLDAADTHPLTILATDHGTPPLWNSTTLTIHLNPPSSSLPPNTSHSLLPALHVREDATVDTVVGTIDPSPATAVSQYAIVSGNYKDSFKLVKQGDGTAELRVAGPLNYEERSVFDLLVTLQTPTSGEIQKFVKVFVTDVNDHAPQFADGPFLELYTAEHTTAGHRLWTLSVTDADQSDTSGTLVYEIVSATEAGMLNVTAQGDLVLLVSPDYETVQKVEAVVTVRDSDVTSMSSSSISVTVHILDVTEGQVLELTPAVTYYISTEIPYNTKEGQLVYQLSPEDFKLTSSPGATVTYVSVNTHGPFDVSTVTGEVTVTATEKLADNSTYFQWMVCSINSNGSSQSEMAMLRIDTYDKYRNIVVVEIALDVSTLEAERARLESKLQAMFSSPQRVGIHTILVHGGSARRRLLAARSVILIYVVKDVAADQLHNVKVTKTFLTQDQILQIVQASPDGTPVAALTGGPLPADLVMPYQTGHADRSSVVDDGHLFIIIAVVCVLIVIIIVFIIACLIYRMKRRRKWNVNSDHPTDPLPKGTPLSTPAPAFHIRQDSVLPDDVSTSSGASLVDDDSGVGDSLGSRSLARKSLTPSTGSDASDGIVNDEGTSGVCSRSGSTESVSDTRPSRTRISWNAKKASRSEATAPWKARKPSMSWLPPLPDDPNSARRFSNYCWFDSPYGYGRGNRRMSGKDAEILALGARRDSAVWSSRESSPEISRRSSLYRRRSSSLERPLRLSTSLYPSFDAPNSWYPAPSSTSISSTYTSCNASTASGVSSITSDSSPSRVHTSWLRMREVTPDRVVTHSLTSAGHEVTWKPKRNPAKPIFNEKLEWKAVSTIPKPSPLPRHRKEKQVTKSPDPNWSESVARRSRRPPPETSEGGIKGRDTSSSCLGALDEILAKSFPSRTRLSEPMTATQGLKSEVDSTSSNLGGKPLP
ncbi:protocadherin Fat 4-like isoform X2 [Littorina saxatilis]|uniref:Cadherin domain-containing protein n=1 Tax=Littorina saxatilis TaxID=31220 RepID=A0AAN9GBQ3_9CAEN